MPAPPESDFDREFRALYCKYNRYVRHVLLHFRVRPSNLDDVSQEVFLAVLKKLPDFEQRSDIKTWIFTICRYKASEERRRAYNRYEQPVAEPIAQSSAFEPQQELQRRTECALLDEALERLSDIQRQVFVRRLEGQSVAEIAHGLGCSPFTVYTRLGLAARKVQTFVGRRCGVASWLLLTVRAGDGDFAQLAPPELAPAIRALRAEKARTAAQGSAPMTAESLATAARVPAVSWHKSALEWILPFAAGVCVMMSPLPSDPRERALPASTRAITAAPGREELAQPARAVPSPAPVVQAAKIVQTPPRPRKRAPRPHAPPAAELEQAAEPPPLPPPQPEREQEILWRSRFALDTNPAKALELTEQHAASHPAGLLVQDREVLAIEALLRLRRKPTALERAQRFVEAYPESPYARPVLQLIDRLSAQPRHLSVADSR